MKKIQGVIISLFFTLISFAQGKPEGLFINSKAPDFRAQNQEEEEIRLKDLVKKGPVVLVFYRGQWCPYCNRYLKKLEDSLQLIKDKGATLVAITPEKSESIDKTIEKTGATYDIIYDKDLKIMKAYDVAYKVDENTVKRYKSFDIDLAENNGSTEAFLPVPALYIINSEMTVKFRFFEPDYKKRLSVKDILENL
jgi:peroxiredoxin